MKTQKDTDICETYEIHEDRIHSAEAHKLSDDELYRLSELFKVFGDTTRLRILYVLFETEVCVCDLALMLQMTQPAISHQLKILRQAGLIKSRREGKSVFYSLADSHVSTMISQGVDHIRE